MNQKGRISNNTQDIDAALKFYKNALNKINEIKDDKNDFKNEMIAIIYNNNAQVLKK